MIDRALILLPLAFLLAACGLNQPYPEKNLYAFATSQLAGDDARTKAPVVIRVQRARVAPPFASRSFQYRTAQSTYEPDYYNNWADDPGELIAAATVAAMRESGAFEAVIDAGAAPRGARTLDLYVEDLFVDRTSKGGPVAMLRLTATYVGRTGSIIFSQSYEANMRARSARADDVVAAWNAGLSRVLNEIIEDVHAASLTAG